MSFSSFNWGKCLNPIIPISLLLSSSYIVRLLDETFPLLAVYTVQTYQKFKIFILPPFVCRFRSHFSFLFSVINEVSLIDFLYAVITLKHLYPAWMFDSFSIIGTAGGQPFSQNNRQHFFLTLVS